MNIVNNTPLLAEALPSLIAKDRAILTVVVKGTFRIRSNGQSLVAQEQIPVAFGDEFNDPEQAGSVKFESDIAPFKPRADIVVVGRARAPAERPVTSLRVGLRVGEVQKIIQVVGDRHWHAASGVPPQASKPKPFAAMDLVYERAFGGIDRAFGDFCPENPVGRGFIAEGTAKLQADVALPNLEDPNNMIQNWKARPRPVGFGFYGRTWRPRAAYAGTYDIKWQNEHAPGPPPDFRSDYYNAAHPDLQVKGYLNGDESVDIINMSPEGKQRFQLPGLRVQALLRKGGAQESKALNIDTLCLLPDEKRFFLLWRNFFSIADLSAQEVEQLTIEPIS